MDTLLANDKYRATLRSTFVDGVDTTLNVTAIPTNLPTMVVVGWNTQYETKFRVTGTSGTNSSNYALTGITKVSGYSGNIPENSAVNCLNNEDFFNQYGTLIDGLREDVDDALEDVAEAVASSAEAAAAVAELENGAFMARQAIINGNFDVWQRNVTFTNPTNGQYGADRWLTAFTNTGTLPTSLVHSRQALTPGDIANAFYFYRLATNGAGSGFGVSDFYNIEQKIEQGVRALCGLGKKVTFSFYAKSSIASKKIGLSLLQNYGTGGSPSTAEVIAGEAITLTSSWVKYTVTFTTNTLVGKTFGTNNNDVLVLRLSAMWGSTYATEIGAVGSQTFVGSGNIDIAQVQVCVGEEDLAFVPKTFADELRACMRYYEKSFNYGVVPAQNSGDFLGAEFYAQVSTNGSGSMNVRFKVRKRTTPTVTTYSPGQTDANWYDADNGQSRASNNANAAESGFVSYTTALGGSNTKNYLHWAADAEL